MTNLSVDNINPKESGVYIVKEGRIIRLSEPPTGFGKQTIHWEHENITRIEHVHTQRV